MSNSPLVVYTKLSPNHSGKRTKKIDTITIHCMAGNCSVETCGNLFASSARQASSNYGIGTDGRIALYVDEANRSWCTSWAPASAVRRLRFRTPGPSRDRRRLTARAMSGATAC